DRTQRALDLAEGAVDAGFIGDVGDKGARSIHLDRLPREDRDLPARRRQRLGEGAAEPAPAAGHHRDFHAAGLAPGRAAGDCPRGSCAVTAPTEKARGSTETSSGSRPTVSPSRSTRVSTADLNPNDRPRLMLTLGWCTCAPL